MEKLELGEDLGEISIEIDTPENPKFVLLLAHGAGAGLQHPFLEQLSHGISSLNGIVIRFNFPYMEIGKKFPGPPQPNISTIGKVSDLANSRYPDIPVFLSGKSYGGRMSSHWVSNHSNTTMGIIYFGFPLHAPGKPSINRADHLSKINIPQLFIQGTNDALATIDLMREVVEKCETGTILEIENGDHSFKTPKKTALKPYTQTIMDIAEETNKWILSIIK